MVRIITDSGADMEPWEYEKLDIKCIPLCVSFGDAQYRENIDLSKDEFYEKLTSCDAAPRTAQPSPHDIECALREGLDAGDETLVILLSSGFSGLYQNVLMVKNMLDYDACHVVDGLTGTGGQRILVETAAKLRDEGKTAAEIAGAVKAVSRRLVLYACMDTLEYLYRGGRISHTVYAVGSLAGIKPILHIPPEGKVTVPAKAMGMKRGMDYLCRVLENTPPDENYPFYVMYTGAREKAVTLAKRFVEMGYEISDSMIINVGAAIGSHVGPNACGLVYVKSE